MSHHSDLSMTVLAKKDMVAHFGEKLAIILLGDEVGSVMPTGAENSIRSMGGYTRSDWFKWVMAEVLDKVPNDSLKFISERACTHIVLREEDIVEESYLDGLDEEDEARDRFMTHLYTLIPPAKISALLDDIDSLFSWFETHTDEAMEVIENWDDEDELKNAIACISTPEKSISINSYACHGEEGDDARFLFCALKSIRELLAYAKENEFYAVYENSNFTGFDWLKNCRPQIINF